LFQEASAVAAASLPPEKQLATADPVPADIGTRVAGILRFVGT
jgi:hypothetical protein